MASLHDFLNCRERLGKSWPQLRGPLERQNQNNFRVSLWVTAVSVFASAVAGWFLNELTRVWLERRL